MSSIDSLSLSAWRTEIVYGDTAKLNVERKEPRNVGISISENEGNKTLAVSISQDYHLRISYHVNNKMKGRTCSEGLVTNLCQKRYLNVYVLKEIVTWGFFHSTRGSWVGLYTSQYTVISSVLRRWDIGQSLLCCTSSLQNKVKSEHVSYWNRRTREIQLVLLPKGGEDSFFFFLGLRT